MPSRMSDSLRSRHASNSKAQVVALPTSRDRLPASPAAASPAILADQWDDAELHRIRDALDHAAHAGLARLSSGLSPAAVADACMDWAANLAISPGKQVELVT